MLNAQPFSLFLACSQLASRWGHVCVCAINSSFADPETPAKLGTSEDRFRKEFENIENIC